MLQITHAGYDLDQRAWGLWAEGGDGQHWFIPTDEATCRTLVAEGQVALMRHDDEGVTDYL